MTIELASDNVRRGTVKLVALRDCYQNIHSYSNVHGIICLSFFFVNMYTIFEIVLIIFSLFYAFILSHQVYFKINFNCVPGKISAFSFCCCFLSPSSFFSWCDHSLHGENLFPTNPKVLVR